MKRIKINLPAPHKKQREIEASKSKRIVINAGRQAGKTFMVSRKAVILAGKGEKVLYVAPVSSQTDAFWELVTEWLAGPIAQGSVKINNTKRTLTFVNSGGRIQARTAFKPDHLRGANASFIILDEFAYQNPVIWTKVCQPMLLLSNGTAMFISTPNMRNHFYLLWLKALDRKETWSVFTFSSLDNPFLSKEALAILIEDMTDLDYRQEILAEFVPGVGAVFSVRATDFYPAPTLEDILQNHRGHRFVAGLDWGRQKDFTVLSVGCATCQKEIWLERTNIITYHEQRDIIKNVLDGFGVYVELLAESNSIGLPNIEQLRLDGVPVIPFNTNNSSKATAVQALRLAFTQSSWKWIDDPVAWNELEAFVMKLSPSGLPTFGAPEGLHDDTVIGRMLMLHQALTGRLNIC